MNKIFRELNVKICYENPTEEKYIEKKGDSPIIVIFPSVYAPIHIQFAFT